MIHVQDPMRETLFAYPLMGTRPTYEFSEFGHWVEGRQVENPPSMYVGNIFLEVQKSWTQNVCHE